MNVTLQPLKGWLVAGAFLVTLPSLAGPGPDKDKYSLTPNVSRTKTMGVAIYQSVNTSTMNLLIENYIEVPLKVRLIHETNGVVHEEELSKRLKSYRRKFNMAGAMDGWYTFEITDGYNRVIKTFRVDTPEVSVQKTERFIKLVE